MLRVISPAGPDVPYEPLEPDDASNAIGRKVARLNVEGEFATVYLTFTDGKYLTYASRIDEEGVILLDRFCDGPAPYSNYFIFDELEGETGPPPDELALPEGHGFRTESWQGAVDRTIFDLGWDEEGMQAFVHFEEGGYLTLAARASGGKSYLLGYFAAEDPDDGEYIEFELTEARADG